MDAIVVHDSQYGSTKVIAAAIAEALDGEVTLMSVGEAEPAALAGARLLVVGGPTHGGRPSPAMKEFLDRVPAGSLDGVAVAVFDTRISAKDTALPLRLLLGVIGYAAGRIAKALRAKGARIVGEAEGFIVEGREGPLRDGETERAASWAKQVQAQAAR
jgi:flavodoxin I